MEMNLVFAPLAHPQHRDPTGRPTLDPFLLVSLVGVAAGLGCGGDKVLDAWAAALVAVHGALGQSPCLGAAR